MLRSMTGYGRANSVILKKDITVEIKSVNHRFFDFNARIPRVYGFLEEKLKSFLQNEINRGKVDVFVTITNTNSDAVEVSLDKPLLNGYLKALEQMKNENGLKDDISVSTVARYNDIFVVKKAEEESDAVWDAVKQVAQIALEGFLLMRVVEGEKLKKDIEKSCEEILNRVEIIEKRSPQTVTEYNDKLKEKITELLGNNSIDETRILTEVAIFADKIATNEEVVRLKSHIAQLSTLILSKGAIGKKLDFIVQEMNREINTIGSKANDIEITRHVVDVKAEIEKIREQIQNIE